MNKERVILTDCDGVMCQWNLSFDKYMMELGHPRLPNTDHEYEFPKKYQEVTYDILYKLVKDFNEGPLIANLKPFADSVKYVKLLANQGFKFVVITALSDATSAIKNRTINLNNIFGDVFDQIICVPQGSIKTNVLQHWKNSELFWIEDHPLQAKTGIDLGLKSILIDHPYNQNTEYNFTRVSHVSPWEEIYDLVLKDY